MRILKFSVLMNESFARSFVSIPSEIATTEAEGNNLDPLIHSSVTVPFSKF